MEQGLITGIKAKNKNAFLNRGAGPYPLFQSLGAGALDNSYFMLRGGTYIERISDGSFRVPRTTIQHFLKDFLGKDLPILRPEDVRSANLVHPTNESPLAFRNGESCMRCHGTMDQMAHNLRNILISTHNRGTVASNEDNTFVRPLFIFHRTTTLASEDLNTAWNDEPVSNFASRPIGGVLYYRDYKGELVNERVNGPAAMGLHYTQRLDFYMNLSNLYLSWLTGTKAYLGDLGDPNAPRLSQSELELRKIVIWLATNLRNDQDMSKLLIRITNTKLYLEL